MDNINRLLGLLPRPLSHLLLGFWQWKAVWIGLTVAFSCLGTIYALFLKQDVWVASQGMIIRDEATATAMRLGRFESQTQMKTAQETLLELARNPSVLRNALSAVPLETADRSMHLTGSKAVSPSAVESFGKKNISMRAPQGAELGTTEIIYLEVKQSDPKRALALANAVCDALERQLQLVRKDRAEGIIRELEAAQSVALAELDSATHQLQQIEIEAGVDLADLRGLTDANSGSTIRLMMDMVRDDLRKGEIELQVLEENLESARAARENPELLSQVTDRLVDSQPTIKKLREALADASIKITQQLGRFTELHPEVQIARQTEHHVRSRLMEELDAAILAIEDSIGRVKKRMSVLYEQESELGKRLNRLADIRANYTNVVAEVRSRSEELHQIRRDLTQALAARDSATTTSLITRLDGPIIGENPVGPGRSTIVGAAMTGGLFLGLGIVFLIIPLDAGGFAGSNRPPSDPLALSPAAASSTRPFSGQPVDAGSANHPPEESQTSPAYAPFHSIIGGPLNLQTPSGRT
jgi:polysaccharide biosynthesis transport protein